MVPRRESEAQCIWMHAVSVGEVNLLAPVLNELQQARSNIEVVISTTTETGFDLATRKFPQHQIMFCPFDFTWAIKRALNRIRPSLLVLVELELWPNLIGVTHKSGVPVAVINGRLSENSLRGYRRFKRLLTPVFQKLSLIAVQDQAYAERFCELGCDKAKVIVTGNVKFDGVETNRANGTSRQLASLVEIANEEWVFVAGSTQVEEDLIAASVYQQLSSDIPNLRMILVPRHPERCDSLVDQLSQMGVATVRRSGLGNSNTWRELQNTNFDAGSGPAPILIVDVIGELGGWWGVADAGYVGGSLGRRGGQNMMEPAAFGIPVSFGPHTANFKQLVDELLVHDAAEIVRDAEELAVFIRRAHSDRAWASEIGARAQKVVLSHVGASQRTVECLSRLIAGESILADVSDSQAA